MRRWTLIGLALGLGCQRQPEGPAWQIVGETERPRIGDSLPRESGIFDGTIVRLRGIRGEILGLSVVRESRDASSVAVAVTVDGATVEGFTVDHVRVEPASTELYGASRGAGVYPDRLRPVAQPIATERMAYFDVAIDRTASAGHHRGEVVIGDRRVAIDLTVIDAELPALDRTSWLWAYYEPAEIATVAGTVGDSAATLLEERRYASLFRRYGVMASPELTSDTWDARRALVAGARFVPVWLPIEPAALASEVRAWSARLAGTGMLPFAIPIDEPDTPGEQAAAAATCDRVRAAGGGAGRFLCAVTHAATPALGDSVDVFVAPSTVLDPSVARDRAWTYNGHPGWAASLVVDADDATLRTWGWLGFRYEVSLWYVWDALYWRDRHNRGRATAPAHDLLQSSITFDDGEDHGALDGVLVYPGALPSLRLAQLRRGIEDRALLEMLARCGGKAAAVAIVDQVVPDSGPPRWPHDDLAWQRLHDQILDGIAQCDRISP